MTSVSLTGTRMFRALFQYLPLRDSPNDQPQLELSLNPGDLIVVRGEMDEDGFYRGETMDGQCGLVPSNYVERVSDAWLSSTLPSTSREEIPQVRSDRVSHPLQSSYMNRSQSPSFQLNVPPHLSSIVHDFTSDLPSGSSGPPPLPDSVCPYPPADVSRVTVTEMKETDTPRVPWPRDLTVEKRLSRSCILSWSPPEESFIPVTQYHICVDGKVRTIVPGNYKTRALVEDVSMEGSCNLSIRAVTEHGHSPDAACTITLGLEAAIAPQHLRVFNITPVSACIRWYPSNSNSDHVISLNAVKVGVCPPSVFQVQVQGLTPSTIYRISVRTKHPKAVLEQRPVERCIDFKTTPKIGLPDPPSNVQVEIGPQQGTLLVSWYPVTTQPKSPSRAAIHSYLVYADGRNIAQVPSPTADHVVLRLADLSDDPPIFITVRTRTREGAVSSDSNVARVPRGVSSLSSLPHPSLSPLPVPSLSLSNPLPTQVPLHLPLQTLTNFQSNLIQGPLSDPLIVKESDPMASSYPSAMYHTGTMGPMGTAAYGTLPPSAPTHYRTGPSPLLMSSGVVSSHLPHPPPLSAPVLNPSIHPSYSTPSGLIQPYGTTTNYTDMMATVQPSTVQQSWKQTTTPGGNATTNQYYSFHPRLLRADGTRVEERPSVLEMENNYVLRHRQAEWGTRVDQYTRQNRALSTDGLLGGGSLLRGTTTRLIPPRLARVKSESGFGTRSEPDLRPPTMDEECRWFVALFDYSYHMSPNPNAEQEELSFRKHQLIKVFGDVDPDGFFHGQIGSRVGLVPSNMVIEIAKDDLMPRRNIVAGAAIGPTENPSLRRARWGSLKSRSYDHAGDRRHYHRGREMDYASLDRRDVREGREGREHRDRERYRRSNGSRDHEERRGEYYDRDREYRSRDRNEYSRNPEYAEDELRRGVEYDRERRDRDRPHHEYRGEEYDRQRYERDRERDRDYHDRRYESGPSTSQVVPPPVNHIIPPSTTASVHLVQAGSHYTSQPGSSGITPQQPPLPIHHPPSTQQQQPQQVSQHQQPYTGNGHVLTGTSTMQHLQQAMGGMSLSSQQPLQQSQQQPQYGGSTGGYGSTGGQMMGQTPVQMGGPPTMMDGLNGGVKRVVMIAKFDYDSRQLSPNVDAEQVELSFRQGDAITIYGDMDEDGFYMGELNGMRGLVPSNFLTNSPMARLGPSQPSEPMMGSVRFTEVQKKTPPARQTSQTSASGGNTANTGGTAKPTTKKTSVAQPGGGTKPLAKKTSDVGKGGAPNARKTSTAVKKTEVTKKK